MKRSHGPRFDQANDGWQDSAARPYDSPLTYGGWIQCQMLGGRIESELRSLTRTGTNDVPGPPRKRRKIVIHSSPYLRCLQTSIAIGAGMMEVQPQSKSTPAVTITPRSTPEVDAKSQEPSERFEKDRKPLSNPSSTLHTCHGDRARVRLDPCLGEWLSPAYFERSIAPPSSTELMAQARTIFETPAEEIKGADLSIPGTPDFNGVDLVFKETETSSTPIHEKTGLRAMAAAGHAMSKRPRRSFLGEKPNGTDHTVSGAGFTPYAPPIPTYAIAPRDAIPSGFVSHARDACIEFDSEWDSMKEPLGFGDGGPFGEEWSSMHRRFRNGLQKMLAFYETSSTQSEEEDLVLVLVTHQAGCNALIRLLTGAPALHDVGTASLSMAIRREHPVERRTSESISPLARRGSLDLGFADDFEMKIIASTEHLRGGTNPLGLNSPRLGMSPALASRRAVGGDSPDGFSIGDPMARSNSGHGSSLGRSSSQRSHAPEEIPSIQAGLWRRESANSEAVDETPTPSDDLEQLWTTGSESRFGPTLPVRSASQRGMWGGESSIRRDRSPGKRRWTAVDRSP